MDHFPEFTQPEPLDGERSWTAAFDSYDMRNDDVYYVITVHVRGGEPTRFMVLNGWYDWTTTDDIRADLRRDAQRGTSNTDYRGYGPTALP